MGFIVSLLRVKGPGMMLKKPGRDILLTGGCQILQEVFIAEIYKGRDITTH